MLKLTRREGRARTQTPVSVPRAQAQNSRGVTPGCALVLRSSGVLGGSEVAALLLWALFSPFGKKKKKNKELGGKCSPKSLPVPMLRASGPALAKDAPTEAES